MGGGGLGPGSSFRRIAESRLAKACQGFSKTRTAHLGPICMRSHMYYVELCLGICSLAGPAGPPHLARRPGMVFAAAAAAQTPTIQPTPKTIYEKPKCQQIINPGQAWQRTRGPKLIIYILIFWQRVPNNTTYPRTGLTFGIRG